MAWNMRICAKSKRSRSTAPSLRYEIINGAFKRFPDGREVCLDNAAGREEYKSRTEIMRLRQHNICARGNHLIVHATFDHGKGRGMGSGKRDDRICDESGAWISGCSCWFCNGQAGSRPLPVRH
jgi:hypothetical protein